MKILTDEESEALLVKGRGRSTAVFNHILNLKPGKNLHIEKGDWKKRYTPSRVSSYIGKRYSRKFTCTGLLEGKGWLVKRIE